MQRAAFVSIAMLLLIGCASTSPSEVAALRDQHAHEKARLDAIKQEIAASEARAASAREQADFEQCRATFAAIRAEVAAAQASCANEWAQHNACRANNESRTAKGGTVGCLVGIAGMAFGGIGAPLAVASCGAGMLAGSATGQGCQPVACSVDVNVLVSSVLARRGMTVLPMCGGYLGLQVADVSSGGASIGAVDPNGPSVRAGLTPSDVIIAVDGLPTANATMVHDLLREKPPGQIVTLTVRRGGAVAPVPVILATRMRRPGL